MVKAIAQSSKSHNFDTQNKSNAPVLIVWNCLGYVEAKSSSKNKVIEAYSTVVMLQSKILS